MTLFNPAIDIVRASDPVTSHLSAQELTSSGQRARMVAIAYDAVKNNPGLTAAELERKCGYTDGAIRKRLNDLRSKSMARTGAARTCSITGRSAQTWWAA